MIKTLDETWEEVKTKLRAEFDRLRAENAELRTQLELTQAELRDAARALYLERCPRCGYTEVQT